MDKFRGCCKHKDGGWTATIGVDGRSIYLGWFRELEPAREARLSAELEYFGQVFDRREIEIKDDHAAIPLHGRNGKFYGYAEIDLDDLELISKISWTLDKRGYAVGTPEGHGNNITMHRLLIHGTEKGGGSTDHRDGNKMNNRRKNLRRCNQTENARNTRLAKNNTSGSKGVRQTPEGNWNARITVNRRSIHIGNYSTREEAAAAYDAASLMHHLEFASPNQSITPLSKAGSN